MFLQIQDLLSMMSNLKMELKDEFSIKKHELRDEYSIKKYELRDEYSIKKHELRDESSMKKHEPKDKYSIKKHELKDESSMKKHELKDESSIKKHELRDELRIEREMENTSLLINKFNKQTEINSEMKTRLELNKTISTIMCEKERVREYSSLEDQILNEKERIKEHSSLEDQILSKKKESKNIVVQKIKFLVKKRIKEHSSLEDQILNEKERIKEHSSLEDQILSKKERTFKEEFKKPMEEVKRIENDINKRTVEKSLKQIISYQNYDGRWRSSHYDELVNYFDDDSLINAKEIINEFFSSLNIDNDQMDEDMKSTFLAILILHIIFSDDSLKWKLIQLNISKKLGVESKNKNEIKT